MSNIAADIIITLCELDIFSSIINNNNIYHINFRGWLVYTLIPTSEPKHIIILDLLR